VKEFVFYRYLFTSQFLIFILLDCVVVVFPVSKMCLLTVKYIFNIYVDFSRRS